MGDQEKDYKVVFIPVFGEDAKFEQECETAGEAEAVLKAIGNYTLLLHDCSYMQDHSSVGMIMKKDGDGDWFEIDEDENEIQHQLMNMS